MEPGRIQRLHHTVHAAPLQAPQQEARKITRGRTRKVIYSGKNRIRYKVIWYLIVRCRGCIMAKYCLVVWYVSVCKISRSRIRRMDIICNDLIYRSLESTNIHLISKACGQTDRQICNHQSRDSVLQTENNRHFSVSFHQPHGTNCSPPTAPNERGTAPSTRAPG